MVVDPPSPDSEGMEVPFLMNLKSFHRCIWNVWIRYKWAFKVDGLWPEDLLMPMGIPWSWSVQPSSPECHMRSWIRACVTLVIKIIIKCMYKYHVKRYVYILKISLWVLITDKGEKQIFCQSRNIYSSIGSHVNWALFHSQWASYRPFEMNAN